MARSWAGGATGKAASWASRVRRGGVLVGARTTLGGEAEGVRWGWVLLMR